VPSPPPARLFSRAFLWPSISGDTGIPACVARSVLRSTYCAISPAPEPDPVQILTRIFHPLICHREPEERGRGEPARWIASSLPYLLMNTYSLSLRRSLSDCGNPRFPMDCHARQASLAMTIGGAHGRFHPTSGWSSSRSAMVIIDVTASKAFTPECEIFRLAAARRPLSDEPGNGGPVGFPMRKVSLCGSTHRTKHPYLVAAFR